MSLSPQQPPRFLTGAFSVYVVSSISVCDKYTGNTILTLTWNEQQQLIHGFSFLHPFQIQGNFKSVF